jgi:hypothetical protein
MTNVIYYISRHLSEQLYTKEIIRHAFELNNFNGDYYRNIKILVQVLHFSLTIRL